MRAPTDQVRLWPHLLLQLFVGEYNLNNLHFHRKSHFSALACTNWMQTTEGLAQAMQRRQRNVQLDSCLYQGLPKVQNGNREEWRLQVGKKIL